MPSVKDWQDRALELEREGCEITVIGRSGRLEDERNRALVRGAAAVRLTIDIQGEHPQDPSAGISPEALTALSKAVALLLRNALAHAKNDHRELITEDDIKGALADLVGTR